MPMIRTCIAACLALVLIVTSEAMAVARGQMATAPGTVMVICHGSGTDIVRVDSRGQPITPGHTCPDCALHGLASLGAQRLDLAKLETQTRWRPTPLATSLWKTAPQQGGAPRAPPLPI